MQIYERKPTTVKNFGIWVRYQSRTGYHNMYKEYRDTTLNGAVGQMFQEMASRHRVGLPGVQVGALGVDQGSVGWCGCRVLCQDGSCVCWVWQHKGLPGVEVRVRERGGMWGQG